MADFLCDACGKSYSDSHTYTGCPHCGGWGKVDPTCTCKKYRHPISGQIRNRIAEKDPRCPVHGEKILLNATLCFLVKGQEILLAMKKQKIGAGCWNGYGGGIEEGETPQQCVVKELNQEAGIDVLPEALEKVAIIDFHNTTINDKTFVCKVHAYLVRSWKGIPQESDEMGVPTWFDKDQLPFATMMLADREWLPMVLAGKKIIVEAHYGPFQKTLTDKVKVQKVLYLD